MQQTLSDMAILSLLVIALAACTQEKTALNRAPGTYEKTETSTDAAGTTTEEQSSTEVSIDDRGKKKAVTQTKTTKDPEGWFNKTTTSETKQQIQEK
jgi:hypothetical protein